MKCVCGYEHEPENKLCKNGAVIYANKPFVQLYVSMDLYNFYDFKLKRYKVFACPKCGTLKVEV